MLTEKIIEEFNLKDAFEKFVDEEKKLLTKMFIEALLKPNTSKEKITSYNLLFIYKLYKKCNIKKIQAKIKKMKYTDFLKTPFWHLIANYAKHRDDYRCKVCGSPDNLNTHHSSYTEHGIYTDDSLGGMYPFKNLVTLCTKCHSTFHASKLKKSNKIEF